MHTPQQLLCQILGITPADLSQAHRLLRLPPDERNPAIIDQAARWCFSRVQAVQPALGPDVARWMMQTIAEARQVMLQHLIPASSPPIPSGPVPVVPPPPVAPPTAPVAVPQPQYPPMQYPPMMAGSQTPSRQPPAPPSYAPSPTEEPAIVIKKTIPRRRGGFNTDDLVSLLGVVVILVAGFTFGKLFIDQWWTDLQRIGKGGGGGRNDSPFVVSDPPIVPDGGGRPDPTPAPNPVPVPPAPGPVPKAQAFMRDALRAARMGAFDEADLNASKAIRTAPDYEEAEAVRFLVAYQRQYTALADQAIEVLNGNNTVFLGSRFGEGAFIERNADSLTFRVQGRNRKFTFNELNGTPGVRFRITEQYLDNADNPANDLILGAWHFIMQQTSDGRKDAEGSKSAARHRWEKAVINGNADIKEQGTLMMKLLILDLND